MAGFSFPWNPDITQAPAHNNTIEPPSGRNFTANTQDASRALSTSTKGLVKAARRNRHSAEKWESIKDVFIEHYIRQDKSLGSAMKTLKDEHHFEASLRQYKIKIKKWALEKNIKVSHALILAAKKEKRARDRGVDTVFSLHNVQLDHERLERLVNRLNSRQSDLPSPSTTTPLGITYCTPLTHPDAQSPTVEGFEGFASQISHHYETLADTIVVEIINEPRPLSDQTESQITQHVHQIAGHGIACRGDAATEEKAANNLWEANNLASSLVSVLDSANRTELGAKAAWSTDHSAPECWISTTALQVSASTILRLISLVKLRNFCQRMLGFGRRDTATWVNSWRLMEDSAGSGVEALANDLFGNPSLPYPDFSIVSLLIKFRTSTPKPGLMLLRLCIAIDRDERVRQCNYCHSSCMLLDFIRSEDAVKIHVALSGCRTKRSFVDWADFSSVHGTRTHKGQVKWKDMAHFNQGMSEMNSWVPLSSVRFRPFETEGRGGICKACHRVSFCQNNPLGNREEEENDAREEEDDDDDDDGHQNEFEPEPEDDDDDVGVWSDDSDNSDD